MTYQKLTQLSYSLRTHCVQSNTRRSQPEFPKNVVQMPNNFSASSVARIQIVCVTGDDIDSLTAIPLSGEHPTAFSPQGCRSAIPFRRTKISRSVFHAATASLEE